MRRILAPGGFVLALVKPQFEAGREHVGKKGVVRDPAVHRDVLHRVIAFAKAQGFGLGGLEFSPVKGPEGNIEYLLYLTTEKGLPDCVAPEDVDALVSWSHATLDA